MDYSAKNNGLENSPSTPGALNPERRDDEGNSMEVKEASNVGKSAYAEALGLNEGLETTGKVTEVMANSKESDGGGSISGGQSAKINPSEIRQQLLENLPAEPLMRKQIETEIKNEIDYLHKKALKMAHLPGSVSYFEMANLMKKIRELKGILLQLVKASVDTVKTLYLRFVHGIM